MPQLRSKTNDRTSLMVKKNNNKPSGRKNLAPEVKRKLRKYYMNDAEYAALLERVKDSRHNQVGAYVRDILLQETKSVRHVNPIRFLKEISSLAIQVNKVGTNINQLSKHANEMAKNKMVRPELADAIMETLDIYIAQQKAIMERLKELIKV